MEKRGLESWNKKATFSSKMFHVFPVGKRGQFFIIAAVIISSVVFGLSSVKNYVQLRQENKGFYDLSDEVKQESAQVMDYGVYNSEDVPSKIHEFTEELSKNIADQDPDVEFVFVYGNNENVTIENYGKEEAPFNVGEGSGILGGAREEEETSIKVNLGKSFTKQETQTPYQNKTLWWRIMLPGSNFVKVKINTEEYHFDLKKDQQFFMVIRKDAEEEEYVDIE